MSGADNTILSTSMLSNSPAPSSLFDLDASCPSVSLLRGFSPFDREKLEKEKENLVMNMGFITHVG